MNHNYIEPLFQPIFNRDGSVFAYEALLRLRNHPFGPAKLVQRWENTGYIPALDLAMVRRIGELLIANDTRPRIAINVSIVTVQAAGKAYLAALQEIAPHAGQIIVELTETKPVTDLAAVTNFYRACRAQGFLVALDDCQPGHLYAAPEFIGNIKPQLLKIDGPFLIACFHDAQHLPDLERIVQAARAVDAQVIAEFISSIELREFALQIGADYVQGFALGLPAPLASSRENAHALSVQQTAPARLRNS